MNSENFENWHILITNIFEKKINIYFSEVPEKYGTILYDAVEAKRNGDYEKSFKLYLMIANDTFMLPTELCRGMAKVLCCMNEYNLALLLLYYSAISRWQDAGKMLTASAYDFLILFDCMKKAKANDMAPLFKRTKDVSGRSNYKNVKSNLEISADIEVASAFLDSIEEKIKK